jgi:hypothetical protein
MSLTIATLLYPPQKYWGDEWRLHVTGCRALLRNNIDWSYPVDSLEDAVYTAFGDFIAEHIEEDGKTIQGISYEDAVKHLNVCACAKKEVSA